MFLDQVTCKLWPSCKDSIVNSFAEGKFGREVSCGTKESGYSRKRGLMVGAVGLMQLKLRLERKWLAGRRDGSKP